MHYVRRRCPLSSHAVGHPLLPVSPSPPPPLPPDCRRGWLACRAARASHRDPDSRLTLRLCPPARNQPFLPSAICPPAHTSPHPWLPLHLVTSSFDPCLHLYFSKLNDPNNATPMLARPVFTAAHSRLTPARDKPGGRRRLAAQARAPLILVSIPHFSCKPSFEQAGSACLTSTQAGAAAAGQRFRRSCKRGAILGKAPIEITVGWRVGMGNAPPLGRACI